MFSFHRIATIKTFTLFDLRVAWLCWLLCLPPLGYAVRLFRRHSERIPRLVRSWPPKLLLMFWTFTAVLLLGEYFFRYHYVGTDGIAVTWRTYRWLDLYWHENSWGYRDVEHSRDDLDKPTVAVVGDSFAAGWGVDNMDDCMVRVMQRELGPGITTVLLAKPGWGPREETQAIEALAPHVDVVVLNYYLNDIENAATISGFKYPPKISPRNGVVKVLETSSALANFLFWQYYQFRHATTLTEDTSTLFALDDPALWALHDAELEQLRETVRRRGAKLVVAIWPFLPQPDRGAQILAHVKGHFQAKGVPVVELAETFAEDSPQQLVVSRHDSHPNVYAHRKATDAIMHAIRPLLQTNTQRKTASP
jgi:hypothetical protein